MRSSLRFWWSLRAATTSTKETHNAQDGRKPNRYVGHTKGRQNSRADPGVGQDSTTANTLLGRMYPNAKIAMVSVPTEILEDFAGIGCCAHSHRYPSQRRLLQDGRSFGFGQKRETHYFCEGDSRACARKTIRYVAGSCHHLLRYSRVQPQDGSRRSRSNRVRGARS